LEPTLGAAIFPCRVTPEAHGAGENGASTTWNFKFSSELPGHENAQLGPVKSASEMLPACVRGARRATAAQLVVYAVDRNKKDGADAQRTAWRINHEHLDRAT